MESSYALVFNGSEDWRKSMPDDWDFSFVELSGKEKVLGHKQIDGAICKVLQTVEGKILAISK